ncbi:MAG: hypothetical protein IMF10_09025 [Proteobacteria bacterium]|nr:hypothetical protein [Pseudomonadota bacterium]
MEHVDNPVLFLDSIKRKYSKHIDKLIITVPNAFKIENFIFIKNDNIEMINSDHRYWFTPYTLGKVVTRACLKIEGYGFFQSYQVTRGSEMEKELLINPAMRDTILMIVDLT